MATGTTNQKLGRQAQKGFTLIEPMIVLRSSVSGLLPHRSIRTMCGARKVISVGNRTCFFRRRNQSLTGLKASIHASCMSSRVHRFLRKKAAPRAPVFQHHRGREPWHLRPTPHRYEAGDCRHPNLGCRSRQGNSTAVSAGGRMRTSQGLHAYRVIRLHAAGLRLFGDLRPQCHRRHPRLSQRALSPSPPTSRPRGRISSSAASR